MLTLEIILKEFKKSENRFDIYVTLQITFEDKYYVIQDDGQDLKLIKLYNESITQRDYSLILKHFVNDIKNNIQKNL